MHRLARLSLAWAGPRDRASPSPPGHRPTMVGTAIAVNAARGVRPLTQPLSCCPRTLGGNRKFLSLRTPSTFEQRSDARRQWRADIQRDAPVSPALPRVAGSVSAELPVASVSTSARIIRPSFWTEPLRTDARSSSVPSPRTAHPRHRPVCSRRT